MRCLGNFVTSMVGALIGKKKLCLPHTAIKHHLQLYSSRAGITCFTIMVSKDPSSIVATLTLSEKLVSYFLGAQVHACVIKLGRSKDIFLHNNLIKMYIKCGSLIDGFKLFDEMTDRNLVSWTLMISGAVQKGKFELGLDVYMDLIKCGLRPNEFSIGSAMKACAEAEAYEFGTSIHCLALKIGIVQNFFVCGSILNMYAKMQDIQSAEMVFEAVTDVDIGCLNAMIGGYVQCGYGVEALNLVSLMIYRVINMDQYTFFNALKACSIVGNLDFGKQLHGLIIRSEECSTSLMNCLMDMYSKNSEKDSAFNVFNMIEKKDVISWNTAFNLFEQSEDVKKIGSLFNEFMLASMKPTHVTFSIFFRLCGELLRHNLGFQFYCLALKFGFQDDIKVISSLISMFARFKAMEVVHLLFDNMLTRNTATWNELIYGYNLNHYYMQSLDIFVSFYRSGIKPNEFTFSSILEACCGHENHQMVRQIHGAIIKSGFSSNGHGCSLLINAYVKFGLLKESFEVFTGMERIDMVCSGTMVSALVHQGHVDRAIRFLNFLMESGVKPDEFILGSILNCCATIAGYHLTRSVHSLCMKTGIDQEVHVASGIVDAYAKSGDIKSAKMAFNESSISNDVVIYNTMIMALAHHGLIIEAMEIFERMKLVSLQPSQATFVSVISACSHMGLVDQGCSLFKSMISFYKMEPSLDVYGCVADMLSRNGYLDSARKVIELMPYTPWPAILRSVLSGCRIHGNTEIGEWVAKKLLELVPENDAPYLLLSKVYAETGGWEDASEVRRAMTGKVLLKNTAYSRVEM